MRAGMEHHDHDLGERANCIGRFIGSSLEQNKPGLVCECFYLLKPRVLVLRDEKPPRDKMTSCQEMAKVLRSRDTDTPTRISGSQKQSGQVQINEATLH